MKKCKTCKIEKDLSEFYTNGKTPKGKQKYKPACRSCEEQDRKIFVAEKKAWIIERFGSACVKCGYDKCFAALDFHHVDPQHKEFAPANLVSNMSPIATLERELEKCIMLCSNCHRELHAGI